MPIDPGTLATIRAASLAGKVPVCEYIKVDWTDSITNYYGGAAWQDEAPFTAIGVDVEPRIIYSNKNDPFHSMELNPDLRTESINVTFDDNDRVISGLFKTHRSASVTFYLYYPDQSLTVDVWSGVLQAPQVYGWKTVRAVATNGRVSRELKTPNRDRYRNHCTSHQFGGQLPTAEAIESNLCPYDRHVGGSEGLYKTGTTPFEDCPRDETACLARFGHTRYFGGYDTDAAPFVSDWNKYYLAHSKGNTGSRDPIRWIFGTKTVRANKLLMWRPEINQNTPDHGWVAFVFEICEGPISSITNWKVNDRVPAAGTNQIAIRLGTRGQAASPYASDVSNFSHTAHVMGRHGWVNAAEFNPEDFQTVGNVQGFADVAVYSGVATYARAWSNDRVWCLREVYTNQKAGMGYAMDGFEDADWLTASTWGLTTVTFTATFPDGETRVYTSRRTKFDAILEGRAVSEQVEDICRAGALSIPFQHEGKLTISPFRAATADELTNARVFTDVGSGVNIARDRQPLIEASSVQADKLPNEIKIQFENAANADVEETFTVEDPDQKRRAGKHLGVDYLLTVPKEFSLVGVTTKAEAVRMAYRLLKFGEFDNGGTENNLRLKITVPFEQALGVKRYEIINVVSAVVDGHLSPDAEQFEYFRVLSLKKGSGNKCEMTVQAYNHTAYTAFESEAGTATPGVYIIGAGTTAVNGLYIYAGHVNSKPSYRKGIYTIYWTGTIWTLDPDGLYTSASAVATPDLATWAIGTGEAPAPTTSAGGDDDGPPPDGGPCRGQLGSITYNSTTGMLQVPIDPC